MKGLIFDMDGTLWDSSENVVASWNEVVAREYTPDRVITVDEIQAAMGLPMDAFAARIFPELPKERQLELLELCGNNENDYLRVHGGELYPEVEETLKKLKEKYSLYIVSNCQSGYIEAFLEYYGFEDYFEDIECYGNNKLSKGENIRNIIERNGLEEAAYIGDIQGDYNATMEAGAKFIFAAYGFGEVDAETAVINEFAELDKVADEVLR